MERPNRSHPTLAPLTSMPTSPAASTSYLYPTTSIPTTPSVLSRPSSQTRLRPLHSSAQPISSTSSPTLQKQPSKGKKRTIRNTNDSEGDWITRTASTLTLTRLEEKGQSWLAARNSSTSLTGGEVGDDEYDPYSPAWQRSRVQSRRESRTQLQQHVRSRRGSAGKEGVRAEGEQEAVGPDFVDTEEDEDEVEGEEVDESEMKKVVMGRVGGWVDWAMGWMDFRGDEGDGENAEDGADENGQDGEEAKNRGHLDPVELQKRLRKKKKRDEELETGTDDKAVVDSAPEQAGVWNDVKWLLTVATNAAL